MLTTSSSPSLRPPPYQQPRSSSATYSPTLRSRTPITRSPASAPSPSSRPQHFPIPILQQDVAKSQYADSGTQYSPPDWPPTSSRSTLRVARLTTKTDGANDQEPKSAAERAAPKSPANTTPYGPPPEPRVRVTPQTSLHNMGGPLRRNRSSLSSRDASPNPDQSSPKRVRQQNANAKVMPIHYTSCEPKDLAALVADMLLELIHYNDEIPLVDGHLTRFHSRAPPGISVRDYMFRLTLHATLSPPIMLSMVYFIDKLCLLYPAFTINSLTVHRFLITAATVAAKGLSDSFWTNSTYARVGGVTIKELALLELELLHRIDWRIVPTPESLVDYYNSLVDRNDDYVMEEPGQGEPEPMDIAPTSPAVKAED